MRQRNERKGTPNVFLNIHATSFLYCPFSHRIRGCLPAAFCLLLLLLPSSLRAQVFCGPRTSRFTPNNSVKNLHIALRLRPDHPRRGQVLRVRPRQRGLPRRRRRLQRRRRFLHHLRGSQRRIPRRKVGRNYKKYLFSGKLAIVIGLSPHSLKKSIMPN